jgi:adenosylcobinamide kinase/adenosylcobinamide-phosphate guanylyltransferase
MAFLILFTSGDQVKHITFVIGGCRSGKSGHAQKLAEKTAGKHRIFIATCVPCDDEMRDRIKKHQEVRDESWTTVEAPILLPDTLAKYGKEENAVLLDCLTVWIGNLLMYPDIIQEIDQRISRFIEVLQHVKGQVIIVSNEVGASVVPENKLARQFRDIIGILNQKTAEAADTVIWTVAGIPVKIK